MSDDPVSRQKRVLRRKAEKIFAGRAEGVSGPSAVDREKLLHELGVHQIELEMQNDELRRAQLEIETSRTKYVDLYDYAPVGYLTFDARGLVMEMNLTAAGLLAAERGRIVNEPFAGFVHPDSQDTFYLHRQEVLKTAGKHSCELVLKRKDGSLFNVQLESIGVQVDGSPAVRSILTDITGRTQAESHAIHLASFPELNPNPVMEVDASGQMTFCNPAISGILEDLGMDRKDCEAFFPKDLKEILQGWDKKHESTLLREVSLNSKVFGETIHLVPQFGVARIYAYDITKRKRAEEKLVRAKEEWERTFASVPDAIALIDNQQRIMRVNEAMARRLGLAAEECIGRRCFEAVHGLSEPPHFCPHSQTLKDGRQHIEEVHEDGLGGDFVVSATPLHDEQGQMIGTVHVAHDVTERRKVERALQKAYDELELRVRERTAELQESYDKLKEEIAEREQLESQLRQAQKMEALGTLSGGIAHDFNNMLAVIIGFTELLVGHAPKGSRDERHLERIMEAGIRGRELVKQLLTFSRQTEQEKKPLLLSSIVKETVRFLRASIPSTVNIRVNTKQESGAVLGDPTQIQQVLMNLCTNAAHAMQEKGGPLDIEVSDFSVSPSDGSPHGIEPGLYVKLAVRDKGVGMPPDIIDRIFDPFFTTKEFGEGTGLGLSVVHGIVKHSGGYITVESEPDKGSAFTVYFPRVAEKLANGGVSSGALPTGCERILFIDDEESLVEMGKEILAELGYDVTSRMSSREALSLLQKDPSRFDLVITDQTMPDITGIELVKEILALRADMPIIMCTGFSHLVDADRAKSAGIRAFAMKPLTKREIARTIRKVLER
jgi:PAS domain S-box-containing protein